MATRIKKEVLLWLKDEGAIQTEDNLIFAEKAFFVNSVLNWSTREVEKGTMSKPQVANCLHVLRRYLKGKLELCWDEGIVKVKKRGKRRKL